MLRILLQTWPSSSLSGRGLNAPRCCCTRLIDLDLGFSDGVAHSLGPFFHVAADHYLLGRSNCLPNYGLLVALDHVKLARRQILLRRRVSSGGPTLDDHALVPQLNLLCDGPLHRV